MHDDIAHPDVSLDSSPADGDVYEQALEAADAIRQSSGLQPEIALVLGSGLGPLARRVEDASRILYRDIPHWPVSTAPGHAGQLVLGYLEGRRVAVMDGRVHMYEGYSAQQVVFPVRVLRELGAVVLILTNAAGGVNESFQAGQLMLITDHLNLTGRNPLIGQNDSRVGLRFPDMSVVYDRSLRVLARQVAEGARASLAEGVYAGLLGPSYETPAEIRMVRTLGGDAVGMSTVMEAIAARHANMRVLGISCITNMGAGMLDQLLTEEEVLETAERVHDKFAALVKGIVRNYERDR